MSYQNYVANVTRLWGEERGSDYSGYLLVIAIQVVLGTVDHNLSD